MTIEWLAGNRITGTSTERTSTTGFNTVTAVAGGWVEVGRFTAGSTVTSMPVTSIPDKRYYMYLSDYTASADKQIIQFNSDTGSNYNFRQSTNGGTDGTEINKTQILGGYGGSGLYEFAVGYFSNLSTKEKLAIIHSNSFGAAGAGTAPNRREIVGKWTNTSNAISSADFKPETGNFASGAEVVVLGWDPADTHTSNFWEELASVELGGTATNLSSGTITAKKYLWIQAYLKPTGGAVTHRLSFNNDGGTNYSDRYSSNGGSDSTNTSGVNWNLSGGITASSLPSFHNYFVINNSANEKLVTGNNIFQSTAGAGNAPERMEFTGKWANTSSQITEIDFDADGGNSFAATSIIKVYGSN
tara:strand:+ start:29 stop:1102 length:1074 start_codon:yes stop_codon:yes gene_type:complete